MLPSPTLLIELLTDKVPWVRKNKAAIEAKPNKQQLKLDKIVQRNRKRLEREEAKFKEALAVNRPDFNTSGIIAKFEQLSKDNSQYLFESAMHILAVANATSYANEELQHTLNTDDIKINTEEINKFSRGMTRIKLIEHLGGLFKLDQSIIAAIINLQVAKDFGTVPNPGQRIVTPVSRPVEIPPNGKIRPKVTPFGLEKRPRQRPKILQNLEIKQAREAKIKD